MRLDQERLGTESRGEGNGLVDLATTGGTIYI